MSGKKKVTRVDYGEFLLSSQINYTLTYFAEHSDNLSHNRIKRYLEEEKLTPSLLWEHISPRIEFSPNGRLIFDDTVLDKKHSKKTGVSHLENIASYGWGKQFRENIV